MKVKALVLASLLAISSSATAGDTLFGSMGDAVMKLRGMTDEVIPTTTMSLEAKGGNFRMYFFTPPDNPKLTCFMAAGTQKGGAACYPKAQSK